MNFLVFFFIIILVILLGCALYWFIPGFRKIFGGGVGAAAVTKFDGDKAALAANFAQLAVHKTAIDVIPNTPTNATLQNIKTDLLAQIPKPEDIDPTTLENNLNDGYAAIGIDLLAIRAIQTRVPVLVAPAAGSKAMRTAIINAYGIDGLTNPQKIAMFPSLAPAGAKLSDLSSNMALEALSNVENYQLGLPANAVGNPNRDTYKTAYTAARDAIDKYNAWLALHNAAVPAIKAALITEIGKLPAPSVAPLEIATIKALATTIDPTNPLFTDQLKTDAAVVMNGLEADFNAANGIYNANHAAIVNTTAAPVSDINDAGGQTLTTEGAHIKTAYDRFNACDYAPVKKVVDRIEKFAKAVTQTIKLIETNIDAFTTVTKKESTDKFAKYINNRIYAFYKGRTYEAKIKTKLDLAEIRADNFSKLDNINTVLNNLEYITKSLSAITKNAKYAQVTKKDEEALDTLAKKPTNATTPDAIKAVDDFQNYHDVAITKIRPNIDTIRDLFIKEFDVDPLVPINTGNADKTYQNLNDIIDAYTQNIEEFKRLLVDAEKQINNDIAAEQAAQQAADDTSGTPEYESELVIPNDTRFQELMESNPAAINKALAHLDPHERDLAIKQRVAKINKRTRK